MRALQQIRDNPLIVLAVAVTGLLAWIAVDLTRESGLKNNPVATEQAVMALPQFPPGPPPDSSSQVFTDVPVSAQATVSAAVLPKLKRGMTRVEVEGLIGLPAPDRIHPVTIGEGRLTYRTAYDLAEPDVPMTIRPIQSRPRIPARPTDTPSAVALEFDASQPGHPLVEVHYSDPLF
jgi:hypothetical protein